MTPEQQNCKACGRPIPPGQLNTERFASRLFFGPFFHRQTSPLCKPMYAIRMWQAWRVLVLLIMGIGAIGLITKAAWLDLLAPLIIGGSWGWFSTWRIGKLRDEVRGLCYGPETPPSG